jgi:hypothetical protein
VRLNNESLRCGPHEVEGITSHQRQNRTAGILQYANIVRIHDAHRIDFVCVGRSDCGQRDLISFADIPQRPEESVSMAGNSHIACLAGERRASDVARTATELG